MIDLLRFLVLQRGGSKKPHWPSAVLEDGDIQHQEKISVAMQNFDIDLVYISQNQAYHNETIAISMQNFSIDLIPASEA